MTREQAGSETRRKRDEGIPEVGFPAKSPQGRWSHDGRCVGCSSGGDPRRGESTGRTGERQLPVPLGEPRFEGTTLIPTADEFRPLLEWYGDDLTEESGLAFGGDGALPSYTEIESLMPDLIAGGELPYDLMSYSSVYFGDFVATGQIEPLDRYLEQYQGVDEYLASVMPAYREFYTSPAMRPAG